MEKVRKYAEEKPLEEAVEQAVQECIKENILSEFLTRYRREAINVSIFEYDEEREMALIRKAEREAGQEQGLATGREQGEDAFAALTARLLADSRMEDLSRAATDKAFRNQLYLEYDIVVGNN